MLLLRFPVIVQLTSPMTSPSLYFTSQRHRILRITLILDKPTWVSGTTTKLSVTPPPNSSSASLNPLLSCIPLRTVHPLGHSLPARALQVPLVHLLCLTGYKIHFPTYVFSLNMLFLHEAPVLVQALITSHRVPSRVTSLVSLVPFSFPCLPPCDLSYFFQRRI